MKKIVIVSSGRSHLLFLASELSKQGHTVQFFSYINHAMAKRYGLPDGTLRSLTWLAAPLLFLVRKIPLPRIIRLCITWSVDVLIDIAASFLLPPCDVLIGHSCVALHASRKAKKKFNAKIICDVGTVHVSDFDKISPHFPMTTRRILKYYDLADKIVVPSEHALKTFREHEISPLKLEKNCYGVDLSMFSPTELSPKAFDVIMVGRWSHAKGADILTEAARRLNLRVLHVGPLSGLDFPREENFVHVEPVPQSELPRFYAKAKICILPSQIEGLSMVLLQAAACGLPIVYSPMTGGNDVKKLTGTTVFMTEIRTLTVDVLCEAIIKNLSHAQNVPLVHKKRDYLGKSRSQISWNAYGSRYSKFIESI